MLSVDLCLQTQNSSLNIVKELHYLNKYLAQHKFLLVSGAFFAVLMHVVSIAPARLIKYTFDFLKNHVAAYQATEDVALQAAIYSQLLQGLAMYGALILLTAFLRALFASLSRQRMLMAGKHIEYALKNEIYTHYQTLPTSFYRKHSTGDLMARISEDADQVGMYLGPALTFGTSNLLVLLILIPYMLAVNVRLTLYAVFPAILLAISIYYVSTLVRRRSEALKNQLSLLNAWVQESFSGVKVLQAFAREEAFVNKFTQACESYKHRALDLTTINAIFYPFAKSIIGLGVIAIIYIGGQDVIQGRSTAGEMAEFVMYLYLLAWPIFSVSWINSIVQNAAASQKRINAFLQEKNPIISTKKLKSPIQGHLSFQNVSFTYADSGIQALKSVSFEIEAGKKVAILGPTGSGKTTLTHLVSRLYDVDAGVITIDGIPIQHYDVAYLRKQLGYVPQDVLLFSDTIKHNIAWGASEATMPQIIQAAQLAAVYENIQQLPDQMDTMMGERGVALSGGQKQRISLARALIRDAKILLLDDCLSAVDTQTERQIMHNMQNVLHNKTVLIVSHRASIAALADLVLVLEGGQIIEQGTPEELVALQGVYYRSYYQKKNNNV